jgi:hypothetical protein
MNKYHLAKDGTYILEVDLDIDYEYLYNQRYFVTYHTLIETSYLIGYANTATTNMIERASTPITEQQAKLLLL